MMNARISGPPADRAEELFPESVREFLGRLHRHFEPERRRLLAERAENHRRLLAGALPDLPAPPPGGWQVAPAPPDLVDRRVEIAGPVGPRIAARARCSGAQVWIADLEDATTPSWPTLVQAYATLVDVVRADEPGAATVVVRPRGWHLDEVHVTVDGEPMSAALADFGLYLFHCGPELLSRGSGPYFYLPKLENAAEARLWEQVFCFAQDALGIARGSIRATVIIETITAAFEMPQILYELRAHASGLSAGRWDYLFSVIKNFRHRPEFVLPDRALVTMTVPFLRAYADLLIDTCHRYGAHAIGGVAAAVPDRSDPTATALAHAAVRTDKQREANEGFDGSWVVHPDLVGTCAEPFTAAFGGRPHQRHRRPLRPPVTAADLLAVDRVPGAATVAGLRADVAVALRYLTAWLDGNGSARIFGQMEGLATVEIARSQVWQWLRHATVLADGTRVTPALVRAVLADEERAWRAECGRRAGDPVLDAAVRLFERVTLGPEFPDFLTRYSYPELIAMENPADAFAA